MNFVATAVLCCVEFNALKKKEFLTVVQGEVQRHGDFVNRPEHRSIRPKSYALQVITNTMSAQRNMKKKTRLNLHFRTNVEVLGQFEINTFSLAETDLTKLPNCHNKYKCLHFYISQNTWRYWRESTQIVQRNFGVEKSDRKKSRKNYFKRACFDDWIFFLAPDVSLPKKHHPVLVFRQLSTTSSICHFTEQK